MQNHSPTHYDHYNDDHDNDNDDHENENDFPHLGPELILTTTPAPLLDSNITITSDDSIFDLIDMQTIDALLYLQSNPDNIIFKHKLICYPTSKTILNNAIKNSSNIIYKCNQTDTNPPSQKLHNIIHIDTPCFSLRSIGIHIGGLISIAQLKTIINDNYYRTFQISDYPIDTFDITASAYAVQADFIQNQPTRYANTTHCGPQTIQHLYSLYKIHLTTTRTNKRKQTHPTRKTPTGKIIHKNKNTPTSTGGGNKLTTKTLQKHLH